MERYYSYRDSRFTSDTYHSELSSSEEFDEDDENVFPLYEFNQHGEAHSTLSSTFSHGNTDITGIGPIIVIIMVTTATMVTMVNIKYMCHYYLYLYNIAITIQLTVTLFLKIVQKYVSNTVIIRMILIYKRCKHNQYS